jgi:hypothetical protein
LEVALDLVHRNKGMMLQKRTATVQDIAAPCVGVEVDVPFCHPPVDWCSRSQCRHKQKLKETLVETIEALEKTRAAFKSKQIEALRKKLIRVLAEES